MSKPQQENPVVYRRLGKSGLRVSVPIVGAASFGSSKWASWVLDEDQAVPLLNAAWERGINTIDTANGYSNGESERVIGRWLKKYNIPRHKINIFTKCFALTHDDPGMRVSANPWLKDTRDYVNQSGLSRAAIFNQVEASLERLQTPYIDLLHIHRYDPESPNEEIMKALHDLVQSGKVRYIGASSMWAWQFSELNHIAEKNGWTKFICMQSEYSLLFREDEREMIPYCHAHGIGLIPWGPLHDGDLARPVGDTNTTRKQWAKGTPFERKWTEADIEILTRVNELAAKKGWKPGQVSLAWINKKVSSPIVGISSVQRLEEAIVTDRDLTDEEVEYLEAPYQPKAVRSNR